MSTVLLAINAGSSSLKTTLYLAETNNKLRCLASASASINPPHTSLKYIRGDSKDETELGDVKDHQEAFQHILKTFLEDSNISEVKQKSDIKYACHRVVHGGDFREDQLITPETFHKIETLSELAPLHNASAVSLMRACHDQLPGVTNVACFDSGFHSSMPEYTTTYAIDQKVAKDKGLRKYGFHGLSYSYVTRTVASYLGKPTSETSIIALHLGSGASACAVKNGKSIDTTMGLTPVSGLPGATRSGDIDPSLVFHYTSDVSKLSPASTKDLHISAAEEILNKKSGWKALTGTTDFSKIAVRDAPETHKLALDIFVDRIIGYVGSYYVKVGGEVDAIVFTGGIGEKSAYLRELVLQKCACLGVSVDTDKNNNLKGGESVADIGGSGKVRSLVCETDEDYEMAFNTVTNSKLNHST